MNANALKLIHAYSKSLALPDNKINTINSWRREISVIARLPSVIVIPRPHSLVYITRFLIRLP